MKNTKGREVLWKEADRQTKRPFTSPESSEGCVWKDYQRLSRQTVEQSGPFVM